MAVLYIIGVGAVGTVLLVQGASVAVPRAQYGVFEFGFLVVCECFFSRTQHRAWFRVVSCPILCPVSIMNSKES